MWQIDIERGKQLLLDLTSIDSSNPSLVPGSPGEREAAERIIKHLDDVGLPGRLDWVTPGRPNAIGILSSGTAGSFESHHRLMLNGHIDTVGIGGMEYDPLKPFWEGDHLHGRGSYDMKAGIVMALLAMEAIHVSGRKLGGSVLFTGVCDEEYASLGTEDVVRRYTADAAINTENSNLEIHPAHKGFAWVTVETTGTAAHGSRYWLGNDAILHMGDLLSLVRKLDSSYEHMPVHDLLGRRSIHASFVEGGKELSTYPDYCKAQFERRTLPGERDDCVVQELEAICACLALADAGFNGKVTLDFTRSPYEIERSHRLVGTLAAAIERELGRPAVYAGTHGWCDAALLGGAGIPTVIFGPAGAGAHAAREYVSFASIIQGARILADTIVSFCGVD